MIRTVFIVVFVFLYAIVSGFKANAQMTLHDCMEYAVSQSTKMRIQEADADDARLTRRANILTLFTPEVKADANAYYTFGRGIDPQTNTYINTTTFYNNYGLDANISLFNGFQAVNNYKISKTGVLIAGSQTKQVEADVCLAVMEAYYNVVYYKRLAEVQREQVAAAEEAVVKARRQEELGQKGHADVVQMEAELADRRYDLINTTNEYEKQLLTLSDLMFWSEEGALEIVTDPALFANVPELVAEASSDAVVEYAMTYNPKVQVADGKARSAKLELNTAKWQLLPSLSLSAGWSTSYYTYPGRQTTPFREMFKLNGGEYVSLYIRIPIWNRLNQQTTVAKKRNAYNKASAELDQKRRDVETEVRMAIQDRDGSAAAWLQAQRKAEVQTEAYHLNLKKLDQGLISPLEFQTANNNYLKAQADEMASQFKYLIKQAVVKYYSGIAYLDQ
jgi:outer membrane protein